MCRILGVSFGSQFCWDLPFILVVPKVYVVSRFEDLGSSQSFVCSLYLFPSTFFPLLFRIGIVDDLVRDGW